MTPLSQSIDLSGRRRAAFEVIGTGPPLFYFQGGPGFNAALLRADAELLADRFSVYLVDPPGAGGSTAPADPSHYDHLGHARFYEDARIALSVGPATIMGTSFGGIVALTYAALYPEVTRRCICIASRVVGEEIEGEDASAETEQLLGRHSSEPWYPAARQALDEWTERVLATEDPNEVDEMMATALPLYTAHPDRPGVRSLIAEWRRDLRTDLTAIKVWESGLYQRIDARPLLADIRSPILVLVGALDPFCGPTQGRLIAGAIPAAELVTIEDSGHFIGAEAPTGFRNAILDFADRTRSS
jgi:pimeloyl-ACP methyl ester carboxylesterase